MRKCTPREIIKEVADIQTVVLPKQWFEGLSDNQSVFVSLYDLDVEKWSNPQR